MNKGIIYLVKYDSGEYYLDSTNTNAKVKSMTKLLGGSANVGMSRWWCDHGWGGWITEWRIKDLETAKKSILDMGYDYIIRARRDTNEVLEASSSD